MDVAELNKIGINQNINLDDIKFTSGEVLNAKSDLEITIKYGNSFNYSMDIKLDENSKLDSSFETKNSKGFYGTINKMLFCNEENEPQILFNYVIKKEPSLFILYKGHRSFYVIIVNSKNPIDKNLINIFNLN